MNALFVVAGVVLQLLAMSLFTQAHRQGRTAESRDLIAALAFGIAAPLCFYLAGSWR